MTDLVPELEYVTGRMRDTLEVTFALDVKGCPRCGARACGYEDAKATPGNFARPGEQAQRGWIYDLTCPNCQLRRRMAFFELQPAPRYVTELDPRTGYQERDYRHLGGWEHSEIVAPHEFARELVYCAAHVIADPGLVEHPDATRLADDAIWSSVVGHLCSNAETSTRELRKFIPEGLNEVPETFFVTDDARRTRNEHPEWFRRSEIDATEQMWDRFGAALSAEANRRYALRDPVDPKVAAARHANELAAIRAKIYGDRLPASIQVLKPAQLQAHADWLRDGGTGERLTWDGGNAPGAKLSFLELSGAILSEGSFDHADFSSTRLHGAQLTKVRARGANFDHIMLAGSTIAQCDFVDANFALSNLGDAAISDTNFSRTQLARTTWYRSRVSRCSFAGAALHDAAFDHAEFVDCDFREADLGEGKRDILGTSFEATFVRCDFRNSKWLDRELWRARFIDCNFEGASGPPWIAETTFENCTPSPLEVWGIALHRPRPRDLEWRLRPDEVEAVMRFAEANGIPYSRAGTRELFTQELGEPLRPRIRAALAAYRRSLPPDVLAERVLDDAIDDGLSFEDTIGRLIEVGFPRQNALEIMTDPITARALP